MMELAKFWIDLEDHFPPAGVRRELAARIGAGQVERLASHGIFVSRGIAERIDCPRPGGEGCPRRIVAHDDGTYAAVCGVEPAECESVLALSKQEIEFFTLDVDVLGKSLARAMRLGQRCEAIEGLSQTFRIGRFSLEPGEGFPIYFAVQPSVDRYRATLRALWSMTDKRGFGVLVPTDRHLSDGLEREVRGMGVVVVPLNQQVTLDDGGQFQPVTKPDVLLRAIGRPQSAPAVTATEVVARGVFKDGERQLTQGEYDEIVANPKRFDIVIDQLGRRSWKRVKGKMEACDRSNPTYFAVLREIVESRRPFDPTIDSKVMDEKDGKQACQRMRQTFDIKKGKKRTDEWRLIKSAQTDDRRVSYRFTPDPDLTFAILFSLPR